MISQFTISSEFYEHISNPQLIGNQSEKIIDDYKQAAIAQMWEQFQSICSVFVMLQFLEHHSKKLPDQLFVTRTVFLKESI